MALGVLLNRALWFAAILAIWLVIKDTSKDRSIRFDWLGLSLSVAIAGTQLILDRGERAGWFESLEILIEAGIVLTALYFFFVHTSQQIDRS